ncbi:MAG: DMT family transporter [Anaerolineae bacterium]
MRNGSLLVLFAAMLWGTTGTAQALAPAAAQPVAVGILRLLLGGLAMLVVVLASGALPNPLQWPRRALFFAIAGTAAYQLSFFAAVDRTGVAVGTLVGIGSAPIAGGVLGYLIRGERLSPRWFIATALAIIGCTLLIGFSSETAVVDALGVLLAVGAGVAYAVYTIASKALLDRYPPDAVIAVVFLLGSLLLLPLLLTVNLAWVGELNGLLVVLHLGLITAALAYRLFSRGLQLIPASTAVTLTLAEPLTAAFLGVLVLGEVLTLPALFGAALLFVGLGILTRASTE